jgi:hypothetical protein
VASTFAEAGEHLPILGDRATPRRMVRTKRSAAEPEGAMQMVRTKRSAAEPEGAMQMVRTKRSAAEPEGAM